MEQKTKISAEEGKQDLVITREFDLPVELLFKAHAEPELIEQWMSNPYAAMKVLKLEGRKHGSYQFESTDPKGNIVFRANGVFHEFTPNKKITRTFEMPDTPFGVQLEVCDFIKLAEDTSKISIHTIYESVAQRDEVLKLPFAYGINMAHNKMEEIMSKIK